MKLAFKRGYRAIRIRHRRRRRRASQRQL